MHQGRQAVCLSIDRRSTLAVFILFIVAHAASLQFFGGVLMAAWVQCSLISASTQRLSYKWQLLRDQSRELELKMLELQRELHGLQTINFAHSHEVAKSESYLAR